jgi:hypothetical protein
MSRRATPSKLGPGSKAVSVRLPRAVFDGVLKAKAEMEKAEGRIVPFSEVVVAALAKSLGQGKTGR